MRCGTMNATAGDRVNNRISYLQNMAIGKLIGHKTVGKSVKHEFRYI